MDIKIDFSILILPFVSGILLSSLYMGMLSLSLKNMVKTEAPIKKLLTGALVRLLMIGCVFYYFISGGKHWSEVTACLVGFVVARIVLLSMIAKKAETAKVNSNVVVDEKLEAS